MTILRRLRGALGMAVTWGTLFATLSATILGFVVVFGLVPPGIFTPRLVIAAIVRAFALGGISGLVFALALSRGERRRSVSTLASGRVAAWGFVAGAGVFSAITFAFGLTHIVPFVRLLPAVGLYGLIGTGASLGILRIARRAPALADELPAGPEPAARLSP